MDPATIAAVASIGGAAIDFFSGERSARKARKHTKQVATDEAYGSVIGRVEAAKAAGLHPLAALGTPSSSGMSAGGGLTDFRGTVSDLTNSYTQQRQWKAEQEFNRAAAMENKSFQKAAADRENARLNADLSRVASQNAVDAEQIRASREESIRRNLQATKGIPVPISRPSQVKKDEIPNMYIPVRDRFGKIQYVPNPDIYDLETSAVVGSGTLLVPEVQNSGWWQTLKQKYYDFNQQRRELNARDPRQNPYRLPVPIGD